MFIGQGVLVHPTSKDLKSFSSNFIAKYVEALDVAQRMDTRLAAVLRTEADLKIIARRQKEFEAAVKTGVHLKMSESNKQFHMAIAYAGKNAYLASFYERLLNQGQRMLHLHFEYLERGGDGYLLTDEHELVLEAIRAKNVELTDELAHAHTRQFEDNFIAFLRENYTTDVSLGSLAAAKGTCLFPQKIWLPSLPTVVEVRTRAKTDPDHNTLTTPEEVYGFPKPER